METEPDTFSLIRASFSGRDLLIGRALRESSSFQALCEDYRECVAALQHWEQSRAPGAPPRRQEYEELRGELLREIRTWLDAMEVGPTTEREKERRS